MAPLGPIRALNVSYTHTGLPRNVVLLFFYDFPLASLPLATWRRRPRIMQLVARNTSHVTNYWHFAVTDPHIRYPLDTFCTWYTDPRLSAPVPKERTLSLGLERVYFRLGPVYYCCLNYVDVASCTSYYLAIGLHYTTDTQVKGRWCLWLWYCTVPFLRFTEITS